MSFPTSFAELEQQGYTYRGSSNCRRCGARMLWYATPRGQLMPVNSDAEPVTSHFATCPFTKEFRRKEKA